MSSFDQRLRKALERVYGPLGRLVREEAAALLGYSARTVYRWTDGDCVPSDFEQAAILAVLKKQEDREP